MIYKCISFITLIFTLVIYCNRFLESQGFKEEALAVSTDLDHKFELAVDLRQMEVLHICV